MKMKTVLGSVITFMAAGALLAGCGSNSASAKSNSHSSSATSKKVSGKVVAVGSTALQPLVEQVAKQFQSDNPNAKITVQGGGSGDGLSQVAQGAVTIGNSDIFAESQSGINAKKLTDHKVAVVGMAPVVNPNVGVKNVTMAQLREIFTGKITNWSSLGGKDQKIVLVNRVEGSGTRATFEDAVMNGQKAVTSQEQDSNGTVQKIVSSTPGAISYLAFSYIKSGVKALAINGVKPTTANVETNKWKIWSYEHMYTKGKESAVTKAFLKYMDSKSVQTGAVKSLGYISISNMHVKKDASGKVVKQ